MAKKAVAKARELNKQKKALRRKRKILSRKRKVLSQKRRAKKPQIKKEDFLFRSAVENMANVSFSYLEKGTSYYLDNEDIDLNLQEFLKNRRADTHFSCGVRGVFTDGDLQVSKPLTWIPEAESPTVKNYLAELWNSEAEEEGIKQINSFTFFLYDDDDFKEGEYGEDFLVCCVITSGFTKDHIEGYLVMRKAYEKEGALCLEGKNIFSHHEDVLSVIVPPMFNLSETEKKETGANPSPSSPLSFLLLTLFPFLSLPSLLLLSSVISPMINLSEPEKEVK